MATLQEQIDISRLDDASNRKVKVSTGFVLNATSGATGIPIPKKFGIVFKTNDVSLPNIIDIFDLFLKGIVTGPLADNILKELEKVGGIPYDVFSEIQRGFDENSPPSERLQMISPVPLDLISFQNVELFFATPGAVLPGFEALNGNVGLKLIGDLYLKNAKTGVRERLGDGVYIDLTLAGLDLSQIAKQLETAYLSVVAVTVDGLVAERNCPAGAIYDELLSSCWSCPEGYDNVFLNAPNNSEGCKKVVVDYEKPTFLKDANQPWSCPKGDVYDPRNLGECWSCPTGFARKLLVAVDQPKACFKFSLSDSISYSRVTKHEKATGFLGTDCPTGQFWHYTDGTCYSCPTNHVRTGVAIDHGNACLKVDLTQVTADADATLTVAGKPEGDVNAGKVILDIPLGKFYQCAAGYERTTFASITSEEACKKVDVFYSAAESTPRGQIINTQSGKCFGAEDKDFSIGDNVKMQPCETTDSRFQSWFTDSLGRLRPLQTLNLFVKDKSAAMCLGIADASVDNGANVQIERCLTVSHPRNKELAPAQQWYVDTDNRIVSKLSGKCLNYTDDNLEINECTENDNQTWGFGEKLVPIEEAPPIVIAPIFGEDDVFIVSAPNPKDCVQRSGTSVVLEKCNGSDDQIWHLKESGQVADTEGTKCLDYGSGTSLQMKTCRTELSSKDTQRWLKKGNNFKNGLGACMHHKLTTDRYGSAVTRIDCPTNQLAGVSGNPRLDFRTLYAQAAREMSDGDRQLMQALADQRANYLNYDSNSIYEAAITLENGKSYLFKTDGTYLRTSSDKNKGFDAGYPTDTRNNWTSINQVGTAGRVSASFVAKNGTPYMFGSTQYTATDSNGVAPKPNYPQNFPGGWNMPAGWAGNVNAAFSYSNDNTYMFKGNQYIALNGTSVLSGYPQALPGGWNGMPGKFAEGIDAATFRNGHTYMIKGNQFIRFTGTTMDTGYPKAVEGNWLEDKAEDNDTAIYKAALTLENGKSYLFKTDGTYLRTSSTKTKGFDSGYPKSTEANWNPIKDLDGWIDAAVEHKVGKPYLLHQNKFSITNSAGSNNLSGYPKLMADWYVWNNLPSEWNKKVDAAFRFSNKSYMFKGNQYIALGPVGQTEGAKTLPGAWNGMPANFVEGIDAATFRNGHTYMIKGEQFIRFTGTQIDPGYPKAVVGNWLDDTENYDPTIYKAAITLANGKSYLFKRDGTYLRTSTTKTKGFDSGYPKSTTAAWSSINDLDGGIDAAVVYKNAGPHLFNQGKFSETNAAGTVTANNYPKAAATGWRWGSAMPSGWSGNVDAAFRYSNNEIYMFKGNQYIALTGVGGKSGYPKTLPGGWNGMPANFAQGIDAATFRNGHTYMIKEDKFIRFTGTTMDPGYPKAVVGNWLDDTVVDNDPAIYKAAITLSNGKSYLFKKDGTYLRTSSTKAKGVDSGYPKNTVANWNSIKDLDGGIDAALVFTTTGKGSPYLFNQGQFLNTNSAGTETLTGHPNYPKAPASWWTLNDMPSGWGGNVDAALRFNSKNYMFKGNEYIVLSGIGGSPKNPVSLPGVWSGMPSNFAKGIDAATFRNGHAYMIKGEQFIRFTGTKMDAGYPKAIEGNWLESSKVAPKAAPKKVGSTSKKQVNTAKYKAAITLFNGDSYLFRTDGQYLKTSKMKAKGFDKKYPKNTASNWGSLDAAWAKGLESALVTSTGTPYMFKDRTYLATNKTATKAIRGYPKKMPGGWKKMPKSWGGNFDASFRYSNNNLYMFKGNEYIAVKGTAALKGYPKKLPGGWKGMPVDFAKGIDAATFRNGHAYMIKGEQFIRFTGTKMDAGYPKAIEGNWLESNKVAPKAAPPPKAKASAKKAAAAPKVGSTSKKQVNTAKYKAAITLFNGDSYLFRTDGQYLKTSKTKAKGFDKSYPKNTASNWGSLDAAWAKGLESALVTSTGTPYMFKDRTYLATNKTATKAIRGYPKKMPGGWKKMPKSWGGNFDASFRYSNNNLYMFKGNEYIAVKGTAALKGYPKKLPGGWKGMPADFAKGIDAATFRNGHAYMIKGDQFIRFTGTKMDAGYPKAVKGNWLE